MTHHQAIIVVDLGYGDAGKGSIVDFLCRFHGAHTVVRFNGGAQAAHNVVTPEGLHHTFAQFGSGTFLPGVRTYLSRYMLVDPYAMFNEEQHLREVGITDAFQRTALDREALIITPFQQAANRLKELSRGNQRHGSCGTGIGETVSDSLQYPEMALRAGDLPDRITVVQKLRSLREAKRCEISDLAADLRSINAAQDDLALFDDAELLEIAADNYAYLASQIALVDTAYLQSVLKASGTVIFEGAQGVLLDECYGFHPYTTWSVTTFANAENLLQTHGYEGQITRLGVTRAYFTRHGPGPFVTEDKTLSLPDTHNGTSPWQQAFRVGYFDLVAARYALAVAGPVDALAVTNLDRLSQMAEWKVCDAYHYDGPEADLNGFFEHQDNTITGIAVHRPPDLDHQAQLTRQLFRCSPRYKTLTPQGDMAAYSAMFAQNLEVPVAITSTGPTARDKQFLPVRPRK